MIRSYDDLFDLGYHDIPDGNWMTIREYAESHGLHEDQVRQWIKRGHVDSIRVGNKPYIFEGTKVRAREKSGRPPKHCYKKVSQK